MVRIEYKPFRLICPDFADIFVGREAAQCLEPSGEVIGCQEVREVRSQLIVGFVVEPFHSRVLDRSVHSLDLTIGPRVVGLGQPVLYPVGFADHVEAHWPGIDGVAVPGLLGELDSIVSENGVDLIGHGFEHVLQEFPGCLSVGLVDELGHGELARAVDELLPVPWTVFGDI